MRGSLRARTPEHIATPKKIQQELTAQIFIQLYCHIPCKGRAIIWWARQLVYATITHTVVIFEKKYLHKVSLIFVKCICCTDASLPI